MIDSKIQIFFAGDFCSKPSTSNISVSDELQQLLLGFDLRVVNFEVPLKPNITIPQQERERFFQSDDVPSFLLGLGFDLFSMANNHAFDWEEIGFQKTAAALAGRTFGAGTYDEAYQVKTVELKGIKIGFLALSFAAYKGVFCDEMNHEGLGCAYINDLKVNHVIMESKKDIDYLFVLPHDGIEYIDVPLPETIARYRDFIEYGADGVIATHPHCPQGWEEYKGKPIFYSLGNFFFNSKAMPDFHCTKPHWYEGRCVAISIEEGNISYRVINTRNTNNTSLSIDHSEESNVHNINICHYLSNKEAYNNYIQPILDCQANSILSAMKKRLTPMSFSECSDIIRNCIKMKLCHQRPKSIAGIAHLLQHDLIRSMSVRALKKL